MAKSKVYMSVSLEFCIEKDGDEFYIHCPGLKGLHSCGDTEKKAIQNARDAAIAYIGSLLKHHEPIPCCTIIREECNEGRLFNETIDIPNPEMVPE
jgi:predicted RNase H-like HicB family nuclease